MNRFASQVTTDQKELSALSQDESEEFHTLCDRFRHQLGTISQQSVVFFVCTLFTLIGGYFFKIYVARMLGAEALGVYTIGMSVAAFFGLFSTMGVPLAMVRYVPVYLARGDLNRLSVLIWLGAAVIFAASLALGGVMVLTKDLVATRIFRNFQLLGVVPLLAAMIPLNGTMFIFGQIVTGFQKAEVSKKVNSLLVFPFMVLFTICFFNLGWGVSGYILAHLASTMIGIMILGGVIWRLLPDESRVPSFNKKFIGRDVVTYTGSMIVWGAWGFLSGEADKLILGAHLPTAQVGVYGVAITTAGFIPILLSSVNPVFAPHISRLYAEGQRMLLQHLFHTLSKWILGFTLPLFCVMTLLSREIMSVFGLEFQLGWPVLVVVALGQLVNAATGSVGYMLLMCGYERAVVRTQMISSVLTFMLYLVLIPPMGIVGAAIGQAVGIITANVINLLNVRQKLGLWPHNRGSARLIFPTLLTAFSLLILDRIVGGHIHTLPAIGLSIVFGYGIFLCTIFFIGLNQEDWLLMEALCERFYISGVAIRKVKAMSVGARGMRLWR